MFSQPIYNVMSSIWDSLYGTLWGNGIPGGQVAWNFRLMWIGLMLAIVPSAAILARSWRAMSIKPDPRGKVRCGLHCSRRPR